ncbi:MAG: hypothetical protein ABIJ56_10290 [Pseudomonadota bacterium]
MRIFLTILFPAAAFVLQPCGCSGGVKYDAGDGEEGELDDGEGMDGDLTGDPDAPGDPGEEDAAVDEAPQEDPVEDMVQDEAGPGDVLDEDGTVEDMIEDELIIPDTPPDAIEDDLIIEDMPEDMPLDDSTGVDVVDILEEEELPAPEVDCGGATCSETQECCFTTGPPTLTCVAIGTCGGGVLGCDEAGDCPAEQVCCHDPPDNIGAECVDVCDSILVCGDEEECPDEKPYCCPAMGLFNVCRDTAC